MEALISDCDSNHQEPEAEGKQRNQLGNIPDECSGEGQSVCRQIGHVQSAESFAGSSLPGGTFKQRPVEEMKPKFDKSGEAGLLSEGFDGQSRRGAESKVNASTDGAKQ